MRASLIPLLPLLLVSATTLVGNPAWAAAPSSASSVQAADAAATHVLGFAANDHFEHAEALTKALKQVISSSTNARLGEGDFSLEVLTAALGCGDVPDTNCLKKIANKTQSRRFIWGTLSLEGQRVTAQIHLYDENGTTKKTQFSYQATMTDSMDDDLVGLASKAVSELLEPLTYKVTVSAQQKEGQVLVDGKVAASLSNGETTVETTSGKHVFRLEAEGKPPIDETTRVRADGTTKLRFDASSLSEKSAAGAAGPKAEQHSLTEPPVTNVASGGNAQRTWGYITLGTGGVLLAAGGLAAGRLYMINHDDGLVAYRSGLRSNEDACTEAKRDHVIQGAMSPSDVRSLCSEGNTMEIAQIVLLAGGVVAAGTGLTLLLTSKPSTKTAVTTFEPRVNVGKDRTDVSLMVRF